MEAMEPDRARRPEVAPDEFNYDIPCLVCQSTEQSIMFEEPPYKTIRCPSCRFVYTVPRLPSHKIEEMYQTDYFNSDEAKSFGYTDYLKDRDLYIRTYQMRSKLIEKYKPQAGRVLDVGSAAGYFLSVMHNKGWDTTGVELSAYMSEYARNELKLPDIRSGRLEDQDFPDKHFDVVSMWDVIEHLEDPRPVLDSVRRVLKDDGILIIETQNVESLFAKVMGRHWTHYKFAEHLYHFSPNTLDRYMGDCGWTLAENSPRRGGKYVSVDFIVERLGKIHPALSLLASPLRLIGRLNLYVNPYDEMIVVCRKTP